MMATSTRPDTRYPPVAREGWGFVAGLAIAAAFAALAGGWTWAAIFLVLACAVAAFFRDPERTPPAEPGVAVAPADGRVVAVESHEEGGQVIRIFLSLLDVHINRSPVAGIVVGTRYRPGRFLPAFKEAASSVNEQNAIDIRSAKGENFRVVQVAGILARRIVCRAKEGDGLRRGERLGLIQFGSRTDLYLPPGYEAQVGVGARVLGGETIVGRERQE